MEYTLSLRDINFLEACRASKVKEILLHTAEFSKTGEIEVAQISQCFEALKAHKKRVVFVWDLLCKDSQIDNLGSQLGPLVDQVEAVRFLDPGVGNYLVSKYPGIRLQYSLEKGTHNNKRGCGVGQLLFFESGSDYFVEPDPPESGKENLRFEYCEY